MTLNKEERPIKATVESHEAEVVIRTVIDYEYADGTHKFETNETRTQLRVPLSLSELPLA